METLSTGMAAALLAQLKVGMFALEEVPPQSMAVPWSEGMESSFLSPKLETMEISLREMDAALCVNSNLALTESIIS
jgi:hypothetical protein